MGKKALLAKWLHSSSVLPLISSARGKLLNEVLILAYHRVKDVDDISGYEFDSELISATSEDFHWQMSFIKKYYNPVRFRDLIAHLDGEKTLPPRPVIVTFDDGFDDNYSVVFPILKDVGVPATIFISSDYIGQPDTFWFDWVVYLVKKAAPGEIKLESIPLELVVEDSHDAKMSAVDILLGVLKQIPNVQRLQAITELEQIVGIDKPSEGFVDSRPMTWEQVKEMSEWGVEFGSHSVSHPILSQLNDDELWYEIADSRRVIGEQIDKECEVIAYPVGNTSAYDTRVLSMAERAGYRLGNSYRCGVNLMDDLEHYALRRIHVELDVNRQLFAATLALPSLFVMKYTPTKL